MFGGKGFKGRLRAGLPVWLLPAASRASRRLCWGLPKRPQPPARARASPPDGGCVEVQRDAARVGGAVVGAPHRVQRHAVVYVGDRPRAHTRRAQVAQRRAGRGRGEHAGQRGDVRGGLAGAGLCQLVLVLDLGGFSNGGGSKGGVQMGFIWG